MESNDSRGKLGTELKYLIGLFLIFVIVLIFLYFFEVLSSFLFQGQILGFNASFTLITFSIPFFLTAYLLKSRGKLLKDWLNFIGVLFITPFIFLLSLFSLIYPFTILLFISILFLVPYVLLKYYLVDTFRLFGVVLSPEFHSYLYLSITPIIIVALNKPFRNLIYGLFKERMFNKHLKNFTALGIKWSGIILAEKNLKLGIYVFHFTALFIVNLDDLQGYQIYNELLVLKKPLLQAFVTFIAFDRITVLFRSQSFKPSTIYLSIMHYNTGRIKTVISFINEDSKYLLKLGIIESKLAKKIEELEA